MSDVDEHCRLLGAGCVALQADLARDALGAAELLPEADQLDPGGLLLAGVAKRGRGRRGAAGTTKGADGRLDGVGVRVPSLQHLRLGG